MKNLFIVKCHTGNCEVSHYEWIEIIEGPSKDDVEYHILSSEKDGRYNIREDLLFETYELYSLEEWVEKNKILI